MTGLGLDRVADRSLARQGYRLAHYGNGIGSHVFQQSLLTETVLHGGEGLTTAGIMLVDKVALGGPCVFKKNMLVMQ